MKTVQLISLLLVTASYAFCDDGVGEIIEKIGGFSLLHSPYIEMQYEHVDITDSRVEVSFVFKDTRSDSVDQNEESPVDQSEESVLIGFPVLDYPTRSDFHPKDIDYFDISDFPKIESDFNFQTEVDGKSVTRKLVVANSESELFQDAHTFYFVTPLKFRPQQTVRVRNVYNQRPEHISGSGGWNTDVVRYILRTGSTWKGNIGKAVILYHLLDGESALTFDSQKGTFKERTVKSEPEPTSNYVGMSKTEKIYQWDIGDFKPDFDIVVTKSNHVYRSNVAFNFLYLLEQLKVTTLKFDEQETLLIDSGTPVNTKYLGTDGQARIDSYFKSMTPAEFKASLEEITSTVDHCVSGTAQAIEYQRTMSQFVINGIFALHGYKFKSPKLLGLFQAFGWYVPRSSETPVFGEDETETIARLSKFTNQEKPNI